MHVTQSIDRMGTGIGDMIRRCREARLREPAFGVADGFRLTIWRAGAAARAGKSSGKSSGKTGDRIVVLMGETPDITIPEIAKRLRLTTRAIEKQVHQLRAAEIVGRVGPARGGHWEVLK